MNSMMKEVGGVFLPATETHMDAWMVQMNRRVNGKLTYQYHKLEAALKFVPTLGVAVDVGAHCGLWSMHLAAMFERVYAFEPIPLHRDCFVKNVPMDNVVLYPCALGEQEGQVTFRTTPGSSGDTFVSPEQPKFTDMARIPFITADMRRLDDVDFAQNGGHIDFIKLDCEGYELFALRGGAELIKRSQPVVCVEQKPNKADGNFGLKQTEAVEWLKSLGAKQRLEISGDFILSWDK